MLKFKDKKSYGLKVFQYEYLKLLFQVRNLFIYGVVGTGVFVSASATGVYVLRKESFQNDKEKIKSSLQFWNPFYKSLTREDS